MAGRVKDRAEPGRRGGDLGDDHRGGHRADAGQLLDDLVAAVTGQQVRDYLAEHDDLSGELGDQLPQRGHLPRIGLRQAQPVQPRRPGARGFLKDLGPRLLAIASSKVLTKRMG